MVHSGRFQHRVAAITGGASGVGREAAARIAAEGGQVILWDRDEAALAAAASSIPGAQTARIDVVDAADMARAAEAAFNAHGRLDILIASAGITGPTATLWEYPIDAWRRVIDVDLHGIFNSCRAVVLETLEIFGADRVMIASNFPVDRLFGTFASFYGAYRALLGGASPQERAKLFALNAERIYRI